MECSRTLCWGHEFCEFLVGDPGDFFWTPPNVFSSGSKISPSSVAPITTTQRNILLPLLLMKTLRDFWREYFLDEYKS